MNRDLFLLKLRLLGSGIRLAPAAAAVLERLKPALRTRSGVSGGLDLVLPADLHVNCALTESFCRESPFTLDCEGETFVVRERGEIVAPVRVYPRPAYYDELASDGTPLVEIGQMCSGDRICIGMTRHCVFWKREERCQFCTIGHNVPLEAPRKTPENIAEAVSAAAADPVLPAGHVLIGGGTPNDEDRGAAFAAAACQAIKKRLQISVYVMIAPPRDLAEIDRLRDSGTDELGMNLEFFTEAALRKYAPGKFARIGLTHSYRALESAVRIFGPSNARSIVIVGLEPAEATIEGAVRLAAMGVMPILSPFRPLDGSDLAGESGFEPEELVRVHDEVARRSEPYGIVPGPTCIPCQNNTLAKPSGPQYRYYGGAPWSGLRSSEEFNAAPRPF